MWHLYVDESGDLGFELAGKGASRFFTVCIVVVFGSDINRKMINAAKLTLRRKVNCKRKKYLAELKATKTTLRVKEFFYDRVKDVPFGVYAVTLDKKKWKGSLPKDKSRVYSYVARKVLDQIPFEENDGQRVYLTLDKSMSNPEVNKFNASVRAQIEGRLPPNVLLEIYHKESSLDFGIQVADLFAWGVFQKYERGSFGWYDTFKPNIKYDEKV